ncbi:YusW family protein [Gracilibacillus marinus]|jgi:hypothetical protein|uniref:YusW family protein n=1 Tax=Gracilibacillus marinus TaxID=630535 RepID=A0ABV8VZK8_9BACI
MKKILYLFVLFAFIVGCADKEEVQNKDENETKDFLFSSFDFDADVDGNNDAIDVEYEKEVNDKVEAKYLDEPNDINLTGDDALEQLSTIFNGLNFDENSSDDEVISAVLEAFQVPDNAENIELEITYTSGTEKEYRK